MRFLMMVKGDKNYEAGKPPSRELMARMGVYNTEMAKSGVLLEAGGLLPSSHGALLHLSGGEVSVTDGPFSEAKEVIGGFAIIQCASKAEAVEHAKRFLRVHSDADGPSVEAHVEIRQLFG